MYKLLLMILSCKHSLRERPELVKIFTSLYKRLKSGLKKPHPMWPAVKRLTAMAEYGP